MKTIITHGANFHSDDIFAVATLLTLLENGEGAEVGVGAGAKKSAEKVKVIRTLEPEEYGDADYIVDIGKVYDAKKNRFDHHQEGGAGTRANSVPYASFGLVWKKFGKELTGSQYAADWVDRHMVQGIDAMDSGMYLYKPVIDDVYPFLFQEYFQTACDVVKGEIEEGKVSGGKELNNKEADNTTSNKSLSSSKKFDKEFMRLVNFAKDVLRVYIIKSKQGEKIAKEAKKAYVKAKDKRVIVSDKFIPTRFDEFKAPEYIEPLVSVYPDLRGGWSAKVVPKGGQDYEARMLFPKAWRGKSEEVLRSITGVEDVKFCHNAGFLAIARSKEGALALVNKAFETLKIK